MKNKTNDKSSNGNNSSFEIYNQIIDELAKIQEDKISKFEAKLIRIKEKNHKSSLENVNNKDILFNTIETDKSTINYFVEIFLDRKIIFEKVKIVKEDINIFLDAKIKFIIFSVDSEIPGPIKIIKDVIILPGKLPECLYHGNKIIKIYEKVNKLYPQKKKKK